MAGDIEVMVRKGGYGDDFVIHAERAYQRRFPDARVTHTGRKDIDTLLKPRFAAGDPPDLANAAGENIVNIGELAGRGQFLDLRPLLDAPSLDQPGRTVAETLLPGVVETGTFDGSCYTLNYSYNVMGLWYSRTLFDRHGWTVPRDWAGMLDLCDEIRAAGVAPFTYQGTYPLPLFRTLATMAAKTGGDRILADIDNLVPGAWSDDALLAAAEAFYQLGVRGHLLDGTADRDYYASQQEFVAGRAAFIPCGSWLENEMRPDTPGDFAMAMTPVPSHGPADALPFETVMAFPYDPFFVPAAAKNPEGGIELLRDLLTGDCGRRFTELTGGLSSVAGAPDGGPGDATPASAGLVSVREALAAAKQTVFLKFDAWYVPLYRAVGDATGDLVNARITPGEWSRRCQGLADAVARDPRIPKFHR